MNFFVSILLFSVCSFTNINHKSCIVENVLAMFMKDMNLHDVLLKDEVSYVHLSCEN